MNAYGIGRAAMGLGTLMAGSAMGAGAGLWARRRFSKGAQAARVRRSRYRRPKRWIRGKSRTGGYYGRYNKVGYGGSRGKERKFRDFIYDDALVSTTWVVMPTASETILKIPQGTGESQRIGRKILVKSLTSMFHCFIPTTSGALGLHDNITIKLILDTQANGAVPPSADVVETATEIKTFNNLANSGRFKTLWTRKLNLQHQAGAGNGSTNVWGGQAVDFTVHQRLNMPVEYDGTTGVITEIQSNNLFYLSCSNHGHIGFTSRSRLRFTG